MCPTCRDRKQPLGEDEPFSAGSCVSAIFISSSADLFLVPCRSVRRIKRARLSSRGTTATPIFSTSNPPATFFLTAGILGRKLRPGCKQRPIMASNHVAGSGDVVMARGCGVIKNQSPASLAIDQRHINRRRALLTIPHWISRTRQALVAGAESVFRRFEFRCLWPCPLRRLGSTSVRAAIAWESVSGIGSPAPAH